MGDVGAIPQDEPLAYFLTWTTYGTWLPGDERGWVVKPGQFRAPDRELQDSARGLMTEMEFTLDDEQRRIVAETIAAHCRIRGWTLHVLNVRTNHVHVVVTARGRHPDDVMDQFKAWCTRKLKDRAKARSKVGDRARDKWWTQRGSKRWLNDMASLEAAVLYVRDGQ